MSNPQLKCFCCCSCWIFCALQLLFKMQYRNDVLMILVLAFSIQFIALLIHCFVYQINFFRQFIDQFIKYMDCSIGICIMYNKVRSMPIRRGAKYIRIRKALLCRAMLKKDIQSIILSGQRTNDPYTQRNVCMHGESHQINFHFYSWQIQCACQQHGDIHTLGTYTYKQIHRTCVTELFIQREREKESIWWKKGHTFHCLRIRWKMKNAAINRHTYKISMLRATITRLRNIPIFTLCFHPKIQHFACFANASAQDNSLHTALNN